MKWRDLVVAWTWVCVVVARSWCLAVVVPVPVLTAVIASTTAAVVPVSIPAVVVSAAAVTAVIAFTTASRLRCRHCTTTRHTQICSSPSHVQHRRCEESCTPEGATDQRIPMTFGYPRKTAEHKVTEGVSTAVALSWDVLAIHPLL